MPKDEWGVKRVCPSCSTRFYDLQRDPMTCPSCGASFDLESLLSKKGPNIRPDKKEPEPAKVVETAEGDEDVVLDDSDDDDVEIDDGLLDDDDDDNVDLEEIADVAKEDDES